MVPRFPAGGDGNPDQCHVSESAQPVSTAGVAWLSDIRPVTSHSSWQVTSDYQLAIYGAQLEVTKAPRFHQHIPDSPWNRGSLDEVRSIRAHKSEKFRCSNPTSSLLRPMLLAVFERSFYEAPAMARALGAAEPGQPVQVPMTPRTTA